MCIAPVAGKILTPLAAPVFLKIGADPAMLSGILFSVEYGRLSAGRGYDG